MYGYNNRGGGRGGGYGGRSGGGGFQRRSFNRESTEITCAKCGKKDTVPFKPREGSEVLCRDCFLKKKGITPRERREETEESESTEKTEAEEEESEKESEKESEE